VISKKNATDVNFKNSRVNICGYEVDRISLDDCVRFIDESIPKHESCHIVLVNAAKIVKAKFDQELASIIRTADLVGADGVPVIWASKLLGEPLPGRVNGTDLMERLVELAAQRGYRLYLLGATQEVITKAVKNLTDKYKNLQIAGFRNGYFSSEAEEIEVVREIAASEADILLVGMGSPMKEKWVRRHFKELSVPIIHGVGGSFDILAGYTRRAPRWMQQSGLEWFYRLCQEPKRMWKRYLFTNSMYIFLVFSEILKNKDSKKNTNINEN
jgi:N-acetylglucosaminyldiphosphoundecaprenol N-acetyl-beta-D-mannosaminyltransferase